MKIEVFGGTDFPAPTSWRTPSRGRGGSQSGSPGGMAPRSGREIDGRAGRVQSSHEVGGGSLVHEFITDYAAPPD
jgi:hypothetical protein